MKKLLYFLSFSMIVSSAWSQTPSGCFTSGNDVSFNKTSSNSRGITKGDFDNDGVLDVVLAHQAGPITHSFLKGLGNGKFGTPISGNTGGTQTTHVTSSDFNNDGNLDIAMASNSSNNLFVLLGNGDGTFATATSYTITAPKYLAIGDINEDGAMDIVVSSGTANTSLLGSVGSPGTFSSGTAFNVAGMVGDLRLGDMNGDNHLDVVTTTTTGIGISLNTPGTLGTFASAVIYSAGSAPFSLTLCDVDNNGVLDVVNTNKTSNTISVKKNNGAGVLAAAANYATGNGPEGIESADINGDGNKDIVVVNNTGCSMSIFYGSATGTMALNQTTQCPGSPRLLVIGSFNPDSHPDIVTAQISGAFVNSYLGNASFNYVLPDIYSTGTTPKSISSNDFNGDGKKDLVVANSADNNFQLFLGNGTGGFSSAGTFTTGTTPSSIISGDIDNDGDIDVVTANFGSNNVSVFYGNGSGGFSAATNISVQNGPVQVRMGNLNTDAFKDLVIANQTTGSISVLLSSGATSYSSAVNYTTNATAAAIAIFDRDADGDQDVLVGHNSATASSILKFTNDGVGGLTNSGGVGTATFTLVTAMETTDLDGDADIDVVLAAGSGISKIYNINATGAFGTLGNTISSGSSPAKGLTLLDINSDGRKDVAAVYAPTAQSGQLVISTGSSTGSNALYTLTNGSRSFAAEVGSADIASGDFDGDGRIDLAVVNETSNSINIHFNTTPKITAGGPLTFCNGNSVTLTSTSALWYDWSPNSETTQSISATTSGTYYTTTSSSWSDWCSSSSNSIVVTVSAGPSAPTISNSGGTTICQGNTVTLTSSQATGNQWYKDGVLISGATNQTYVASTSGSYTVTYTNAGCTSPQSTAIVLTVSQTPVIVATGPTTFCTGGSVILHSNIGTNLTWSPGGATTQDITVTTSGTYTATNTVGGCPALVSNSITVTISGSLSTPTISPAGPITLCPSGTVTLTSSSATNNIWSTGATTQSIVVSSAGSYFVHLDNGSCSSANSTAVSVSMASTPATPTITAGGPTTFCSGGSVTLTASAGTTYLWSTGATTASISVTTSGSYTVQVTNAAGCLSAASTPTVVTVNALPSTPTITAGGPTTFCAGGSVTLTASAGTTYLWSPGGATTSSISATTSGSYTVQVTNPAGCLSAASTPTVVTVNALPATPTITAGGPTTFCAGGSVTLTASAGTTYLWSPGGATTSSISATTSGSYTVQVTNPAGCLSAASTPTVVTVNALPSTPTITAGGPTTFCSGGSVTLTASAGTTYLWSPGGATTASISATTSGSYTVQVTNPAGCLSAASTPTVVTVNALPSTPTITAGGPTTFCSGGSVTLTASAGTTYLWSPGGATTSSISATTSGSYTVQVTNPAGCLSAASTPTVVTVNALPSTPTITAGGPTTFCAGGSVTLTASAGTTYLWSPGGATTSSISATTSGSYTVQVTNPAGCLSTASTPTVVTVNALPSTPTITAGGPTTFCSGGSVTLTSSAGTTYLWSPGGATTSSISATTSGSYTVQVTNPAGCLSAASAPTPVTVTTTPATPTITPSGSTSICAGGSVTLTASAGTTYLWSTGATTASINVTAAGSYTVQVTNAGGCLSASSTPTTVTVNALPAAPTITAGGPTTFCADGSVTLTASAGTTYLWSTGATTASISAVTSGSYTVQVTNPAGCLSPASSPTVVTVNAAPATPTITAGGPTTFCAGGSVTLTASAGTTYLWSTGATTASISATTSGSYTVQVTNPAGCLSTASAPTTVTVNTTPAAPTITAGGPTTFCAGGSVTLTSSAGTSYLWSTGATTASISVTAAGSYTVQVTTGGCTSPVSSPTTIIVNALPATPTITAGGSTTFCAGGSVTLTASAGTTYLWSTGATTPSISATTSGSYTVQVTNPAGCLSAASTPTSVTVNALPATPTITPSGSTSICAGGSVTLTASAGTTYLWSTGETTASIIVTAAGSYTVQVTNATGCLSPVSSPTTVTVNALPATPTITAGSSTTFCAGGSVTLTASAGTTYLWSTGATTASISATTSGSYTVQVTNPAGCLSPASSPTTVTVNALPAAPTITAGGPTTFCSGGSVTLTASAGNTYLWSTGATTASINVTTSGSYTVQVTNATGCLSTASAATIVTVNTLPATPSISNSGSAAFCLGNTVTLTSSAGTSYIWSTGATTQSIVVGASGSYTVQVTNAAGCLSASSSPVNIMVNSLPGAPTISASGPTTFCADGSVTLTSSNSNAYLWSTGQTTQSIVVTASGNYSVQEINGSGCQSVPSNVISVTVNPLPTTPVITASGPTTMCTGGSVTLTSDPGVSYLWSTGATTASINVTTAGSYTVQITDVNGCTSLMSTATNVIVNPIPSVPTITAGGSTTFCAGGSVVLTSSASSGNVWSTGETTQSITVTTPGSYTVEEITGGCASGNSAATSVTVNPNPPVPTITAGGPTTFCAGNNVVLTSSAASNNLWSTGETTQSITVTTTGSYSVTVTNGFGCTTSSASPTAVVVNPIPSAPTISAGGPTTFCSGGSLVLTSSAATGNLWSTGETTQSIVVTATGSYTVTQTLAGCSSAASASMDVLVNPTPATPTITAGSTTTFCAGGSVVLTSTAGASYLWSTGETTQSITVTTSGSYSVQIVNGPCTSATSNVMNVTVNPIPSVPTITAGGSTTFCSGGSVVLTSSAPSGNLWSTGETTQSITVTTAGSYTVEQIVSGCSSGSSISTNVTVNPTPSTPTISAGGVTTFCNGGSVVLTSTVGASYLWSTGETTQSITVTTSGSYSVQIVSGPCTSASSNIINVTVNPIPVAPTITAGGPTTFCTGGSVVLTSSVASGNTWSTGATTQSITVSTSGTYTVNVTSLGCTSPNATQTVTVNPIPAAPTISAGGPTTFCAGGSVVLTSSAGSGNTWSTTETTQSITVNASGSYTVTQTVLGCTSSASIPVNVTVNAIPAVPTITASGPTTFCAGGSVVLTSSSASNNFWSNGATTQSITVSSSGTFLVQVITNGCSSGTSAPKIVTVNSLPPAPTIVTGTTESICAGSSVTLTSSSTGGNLWSSGENTQSITVSAAGNFFVTVTDGNGCVSPASPTTVVTVNPIPTAPVISPNGPTSFCSGGSVMLSSSYASGNLWSSGSTANAVTVSSNGTYSVTYTDVNGCVSSPSTPVTVTVNSIPAAPVITASGPTTFCAGGSVTLTSSYATGNSWSTSAMTPSITTSVSGVYSVIYVDGNGCASASSAPVVVNVLSNPAPPSITAGGATTICQGSFVTLTSSYTSGNTWSSGGVSQSINATVSGNYTVTYTNVNGCTGTSSPMTVTVIPVSSIPNISASGSTTICDGSSVTLTSSDPNSTWSTGATTQSIVVTTSGSYSVVGNQTGCPSQSSAPVVVNVNPAPATPIITPSGPTTICEGEELFLFTSGTGTNTWSTGYIGQVLQVTASGNYWVSVQNVYGCSSSSVVVPVVVNSNPIVTVNPFQPLCSYAAPFTMSNGLPAGGTYTGNGISNNIFSPGTAGIGSSIVTYTYVDVNDCSANAQTTIDVNDCAGIDEKEETYFSLFPNPNNGQFKVISTGTPMDQIIIYDAQGKMVFNESYPGIFTLEFDLNAYSNGVYYIEINSDLEIHERMPLIINH
nr:FG-GAP-like repeat-containing protein [uncultured Fluviicola sp.]